MEYCLYRTATFDKGVKVSVGAPAELSFGSVEIHRLELVKDVICVNG